MERITKRTVDQTSPGPKDVFRWDEALKGFGLKVTPKGRKVFIFQYRSGGRGSPTKRVTIGDFPALTADQARRSAEALRAKVSSGGDPRSDVRQRQQEEAAEAENTFKRLVDDFVADYAKRRQRNWEETERLLKKDGVPAWGSRPAASIGRRDLSALLSSVADRAPITANRLLAALRKLFNWAVSTGRLETSPAAGLPAPERERSRDRVLGPDELARVVAAARTIPYPFGPFFLLLALTGQRRDEVAGMSWREVDGSTWTIPAARSKNGKAHVVHLSPAAQQVLARIPGGGGLVFTTNGKSPISGFSRAKRHLDSASGVANWRLHDLRRTMVTRLAALGHPHHVCDKLLNHSTGAISGVAAVYQRHDFMEERRKALEEWAASMCGPPTERLTQR